MSPVSKIIAPVAISLLGCLAPSADLSAQIIGGAPEPGENWPHPASPAGNPFVRDSTGTIAQRRYRTLKSQLGKALFWEEQVSMDNTMACGTCHAPSTGGTDARPGPFPGGAGGVIGVIRQHNSGGTNVDYGDAAGTDPSIARRATFFHVPTMIGAYVFALQFWGSNAGPGFTDGTTTFPIDAGLEDQADNPPVSDVEMGHDGIAWGTGSIENKLGASMPLALVDPTTIPPDIMFLVTAGSNYNTLFDKVFQFDPNPVISAPNGVTQVRFAMAVAHYMRTLVPDRAPIDIPNTGPIMIGFPPLTSNQRLGHQLMRNRGCFSCHAAGNGLLLANGTLSNAFDNPLSNGLPRNIGRPNGTVKTPTLRNVGLRTRFFSDGLVTSFTDLMTFYVSQGSGSTGLGGFNATQLAAIRNFMENGLTDPRVKNEQFPFDRPQLASERPEFVFESNEYGLGTAGSSGLIPEIIANSPPLVLGPTTTPTVNWFKVGVGNAPANSFSALLWSNMAAGPGLLVQPPFAVVLAGNTNAQGINTVHVPFPLNTPSIGTSVFTQWIVIDGSTRALSNGAEFKPFQF